MSKLIFVTSSSLLLLGAAYSLNAAPVYSAKEFRLLADRPTHFPAITIFNGRSYERLTGAELKSAIIGKSVDPVNRCRGCTDSGRSFNSDGTYLADGDRWTEGGRYAVARDMVLVRLTRGSLRYAFYHARDGGMLLAFESSEGGIHFVEAKATATITSPATTVPESEALPRVLGGSELRQLIRGAIIGEAQFAHDWMNEVFRRDGSYQQTDGAREGDVGTYYFSGNRFCTVVPYRKMKRCRSVLIDRDKQTWLIEDGEESRPVRVNISHF